MSKTTFVVIGFGHIGQRHAEIIFNHSECQLLAIIDKDEHQKNKIKQTSLGEIPFHESLEKFFQSNQEIPDVACICLPNGIHAAFAIQLLNKGIHVLIEKPMCLSKDEGLKIIESANRNQKKVFVVKQNRYSPPSIWMKEIIESGILGQLHLVQINCFWNRDERYYLPKTWRGNKLLDGGTLFTQFSHFVDIMYWVFGDITNIQSRFYNFNHQHLTEFEDSGLINFDFQQSGAGTLQYSTSIFDKNLESSMTVIGENGSFKIGGQYMNEVIYCHIKDYKMPVLAETNLPNQYGLFQGSASNHQYVFENILSTLKGESAIATKAEDGLMVVDIIERMYAAGRQIN
ncbi:MAG: Gfo/Idh/MocA family protein [Bacteroidia bacterium]